MTTTNTKTIKSSGGDYSTLSAWEAARQANLVSGDLIEQAECYDFALTDSLVIGGWTTGASNYIRIYTPTGQRHNGTSRDVSGVGFQITSSGVTVEVQTDYTRFEGLELKTTGATHNCIRVGAGTISATNNQLLMESCICYATATNTFAVIFNSDADTKPVMRNCIVMSTGNGIACSTVGDTEISNCTVFCTGIRAFRYGGGGTHVLKNNFGSAATPVFSNFGGGTVTGSNNASTDATADDDFPTGALINLTASDQFVSVTAGAEDFHLKSGAALIDAGVTLAAVPLDIVGTTRG